MEKKKVKKIIYGQEENKAAQQPLPENIFVEKMEEGEEIDANQNEDIDIAENDPTLQIEEPTDIKETQFIAENMSKPKAGKINKHDIFWLKVWSMIVSINLSISLGINKVVKWIFKKELPLKYVRAGVAIILTIIFISIIMSPFRINVQKSEQFEVFSDNLIAYQEYKGIDEHNAPIYNWGFKDKKGNKKIEAQYMDVTPFSQGVAFAYLRKKSGDAIKDVWIMINTKGKQIGNAEFYTPGIFRVEEGGRTLAKVQDLDLTWAFVNKNGKIIVSALSDASDFKEHRARVRKGSVEYYIDETGKVISQNFFETRSFSSGLAAVKDETGLWGYINKSGKIVIPPEFIDVGPFLDKYAKVRIGNSIAYIDRKGQKLLNASIDFKAISNAFNLIDFDNPITTYSGYPVIENMPNTMGNGYVKVFVKQK